MTSQPKWKSILLNPSRDQEKPVSKADFIKKTKTKPDVLEYLKKFKKDNENWKFSKSKQNYILRNLYTFKEKRHDLILHYLKGIEGSSKQRVQDQAKKICENKENPNYEFAKKINSLLE